MTEKEKMLAGLVYDATDQELLSELMATREALYEFNLLRPTETQRMKEITCNHRRQLLHWPKCQHLHGLPQHRPCGTQKSPGVGQARLYRQ